MKKLFYVFTTFLLFIGNYTFAQDFVVCDTECRTFPLGDCASGHTDSDNIEWPCEITIDDSAIGASDLTPDDLELLPNVDTLDIHPQIVGIPDYQSRIAMTFDDIVVPTATGYKILRNWTVLDWLTGNIATYSQIINNNSGILRDCSNLVCHSNITVQPPAGNITPVDIWVADILVGDYSHCDLSNYQLEITDTNGNITSGVGMVSTTEAGIYTTLVTDPTSGNACWGNLTVVESTTSGSCNLACNDLVMVSLAATATGPSATLVTDVFLEGAYPNCDITTFEISVVDSVGNTMSGIGSITVTQEGTYTYTITDPATGNQCWGTMIVEDRSVPCNDPFEICDTECRTAPLGDCTSGHTDTDNVEWPCDVTFNDATISFQNVSPDDLENLVDLMDARPTLVNEGCNLIGTTFADQVFNLGADGFKILRTWTLVHWNTGDVYEYTQTIQNTAGFVSDCGTLVCNDLINASLGITAAGLSATLDSDVFLEGGYPNCDLSSLLIVLTDAVGNTISGTGNVTVTEEETYTYTITDPATGNSCWGTLIVEDKTSSNCPFEICDTECRTAPLGDCASGHTDTDNIEWPCDITIEVPGLTAMNMTPNDLLSINGVDERDAEPIFENFDANCHVVGMSFNDSVIDDGSLGFKIIRTWTIIDWLTGNVFTYSQIIKNLSPSIQSLCEPLECINEIVASITNNTEVTITTRELLTGNYPNCNLENLGLEVKDEDHNMLVSGIGTVSLSNVGKMFYSIAELETNNFCRGEITIELDPNTSSVEEASALQAINIYPNPATDILLFDYKNLDLKGDISISILDESGRQLLQEINNNRLNINKLSNGLYIYQIRLNEEVRYGKFTVLK